MTRPDFSLGRAELYLDCGAEVGAAKEVAMRAREGVLNQHLRSLSLSNASFKLTKLCFDEAGPGPAFATSCRYQCADLSKCEPSVLAELDQRHAFGARGVVVPSSSGPPGR